MRALVLPAVVTALLVASLAPRSARACFGTCSTAPWPAPTLLTPTVPSDLGPLILVRHSCETPVIADVMVAVTGPGGPIAGKAKQLDLVPAISGSIYKDRDGRLVAGFLPDTPLVAGVVYELSVTLGGETTKLVFTASAALGPTTPPPLSAPVATKKVPTRACCQGGSAGCGPSSDPDPPPEPTPIDDTTPPERSDFVCRIIATLDEPETTVSFPFAEGTTKSFFDYRLYDDNQNQLLARFSGRRLASAKHVVRLVQGTDRCFRLEMDDLLRGGTVVTKACTGVADVPPKVETFCEDLGSFATCNQTNAALVDTICNGFAGGGGAGSGGGGGANGGNGGNGAGEAGNEGGGAGNGGSDAQHGGSDAGKAGSSAGDAGSNVGGAGSGGNGLGGSSPAGGSPPAGGRAGNAGVGGTAPAPSATASPEDDGCSLVASRGGGGLAALALALATLTRVLRRSRGCGGGRRSLGRHRQNCPATRPTRVSEEPAASRAGVSCVDSPRPF